MELRPAGRQAALDRYIGYWEPHATSHDSLDKDEGIQGEVRNAARTLLAGVAAHRAGVFEAISANLTRARNK